MNFAPLERIADAVLYEGYILYPYRPSSLKNRQRWNFGTLYPRTFAERQSPPEACSFHAELLVAGKAESRISPRVRFLQLVAGDGENPQDWGEGFTRSLEVSGLSMEALAEGGKHDLKFTPEEMQGISKAAQLSGRLALRADSLRDGLWRLKADFSNETPTPGDHVSRRDVQTLACVSAHLLLGVEGGAFVSLLDPQPEYQTDAAACLNRGVFPVLAARAPMVRACSARPSSCTTIRRLHPRAPATSLTAPRWTKCWRCAC